MSGNVDELLRAWTDEGDEILPAYYLDAALRQVADTPQRSARWAAMRRYLPMSGLTRTVERPIARYGLLAAAAVAAVAVGIGIFYRPAPNVGDPPAPRAFTQTDVDRIVLGEADAPAGSAYARTDVGRSLLGPLWYLESGADLEDRGVVESRQPRALHALAGYVHARSNTFDGASRRDPRFVSTAVVFDDAESAAQAMTLHAEEYRTTWVIANPTPINLSLGDEGLLFSVPAADAEPDMEPAFFYLWRVNNLLLSVVAVEADDGEELEAMEAAVRTMALEMDRRAQRR